MKFEERKIIVKLGEDGEDQARLEFNEPLETERMQLGEFLREQKMLDAFALIRKNCIGVDNLFFADDRPVSVDDVKSGNIRGSHSDAIILGYFLAINPKDETPEKNG